MAVWPAAHGRAYRHLVLMHRSAGLAFNKVVVHRRHLADACDGLAGGAVLHAGSREEERVAAMAEWSIFGSAARGGRVDATQFSPATASCDLAAQCWRAYFTSELSQPLYRPPHNPPLAQRYNSV